VTPRCEYLVITNTQPAEERGAVRADRCCGGTGDIAFRAAKAAGSGFRATVCDINTDMLDVGRNRATARHLDQQVSFVEGNAEALAFPTAPLTPTPSRSGSATCRGSMPAAREAYRVLRPGSRFLCLEFSTVDVPGSTGSMTSSRSR